MKSPYNGEYYIGFVLDVIKNYLDLEDVLYYNLHCTWRHSECDSASIVRERGNIISVLRKPEDKYLVENFPSDRDFSDFQHKAPSILEQILKR